MNSYLKSYNKVQIIHIEPWSASLLPWLLHQKRRLYGLVGSHLLSANYITKILEFLGSP